MRGILITAFIFATIPFIFMQPWLGVLVFSWFSYMNPHRLAWGFVTEMPFAEQLRPHPERRAEHDERRVGERELLVRGGEERGARVVREHCLAGRQIDGDRAGSGAVVARQRRAQALSQGRAPCRCRQETRERGHGRARTHQKRRPHCG